MHYYVDGYNLMFRIIHDSHTLAKQREGTIQKLNTIVQLLNLDVTLVFDAQYRAGERSHSRCNHLKILFTSQGETADNLMIDLIAEASKPRQETVVTSDKQLGTHIRDLGAHTESVEHFLQRINLRYRKRLYQPPLIKPLPPKKIPPTPSVLPGDEDCINYLNIFEERFKLMTKGSKKPPPQMISNDERWLKIFEERAGDEFGA